MLKVITLSVIGEGVGVGAGDAIGLEVVAAGGADVCWVVAQPVTRSPIASTAAPVRNRIKPALQVVRSARRDDTPARA
jgi:hypothetical protein